MVNWNMGKLPDHWSDILIEIRKEAGLTRPELSMMSGVGTSTIENYERNKIKEPSIYKVEQLLRCMGYELDALKEDSVSLTTSPQ
jgi:transcriptional regulator with XRE-family HTH domain|tara:strand:- start:1069 stop:1323 length:255 start_codon:yes stop_codon:yes gene_type:complete